MRTQDGDAVIVIRDFLTHTMMNEIIRTATELRMGVMAEQARSVEAGALMSYGPDIVDVFRQAAVYVDGSSKVRRQGTSRSRFLPA